MAKSRKKFWRIAGLVAVAVVPVLLVEGIRIAVVSQSSEDLEMQVRTLAMGDIMEAVFRYQIQDLEHFQNAKVAFLKLVIMEGTVDLSKDFMDRFAGHTPPVKHISAVGHDEANDLAVFDKETGKFGVILSIWPHDTLWKSPREVEVLGDYYFAAAAGKGFIYTVKLKKGKWVVVNTKLYMLS